MPAFTVPAHSAIQWDEKLRKSYMDIVGKGGSCWRLWEGTSPPMRISSEEVHSSLKDEQRARYRFWRARAGARIPTGSLSHGISRIERLRPPPTFQSHVSMATQLFTDVVEARRKDHSTSSTSNATDSHSEPRASTTKSAIHPSLTRSANSAPKLYINGTISQDCTTEDVNQASLLVALKKRSGGLKFRTSTPSYGVTKRRRL